METDLISGEIGAHMVFDPDKIIQLVRPFANKGPFPADIQVTAFAEGAAGYPGLKIPAVGPHLENRSLEKDIRDPHGFM
jgi:hypothetical protein